MGLVGMKSSLGNLGGGGASTPSVLQTAIKSADESKVSDAIFSLDDDLQVELEANSTYFFMMMIQTIAETLNPDMRTKFVIPSGATGYKMASGTFFHVSASYATTLLDSEALLAVATSLQHNESMGVIKTGSTAGTFGLSWAQVNNNVQFVTLKEGSVLMVWKVA